MAEARKPLPFYLQFTAGAVAGISEISAMYPLDVVKTRLQLHSGPGGYTSIGDALSRIVREEGFSRLYRGIVAPLLVEAPKRATKFAANEQYGNMLKELTGRTALNQPMSVAVGVASGMTEALVVSSFELVKVRMQDAASAGKYRSTLDCILRVLREEGPLAFARGLEATLWRHAAWNGGYFGVIHAVRERLRALAAQPPPPAEPRAREAKVIDLPAGGPKRRDARMLIDFTAGAVGGTVGTMLNTPFDVAKTRIQGATAERPKFLGRWALPAMREIARDEGLSALYKGFVPKVLRLGPGGGILLVVFETVSDFFRGVLVPQ